VSVALISTGASRRCPSDVGHSIRSRDCRTEIGRNLALGECQSQRAESKAWQLLLSRQNEEKHSRDTLSDAQTQCPLRTTTCLTRAKSSWSDCAMEKSILEIRRFMEDLGIPGRDLWELPDSPLTFPDGAHWRIEIAGIERASTMAAMIDESHKRDVPVHRAIATVGGSTYLDAAELRAMAQMAHDEGLEVIMGIGPRKGWDVGAKESANWEGAMLGLRLRGSDSISYWLADMMRNIEAGFRGFLVYDEGVLSIVSKMREQGFIPEETVFKCSVFSGHASPAGARVVAGMGANTFNPCSDVSLPILAAIRKTVSIPLDVYISICDALGGEYRIMETPEIARVASPCYFKIEPAKSEMELYKPWTEEGVHATLVREKVKMADVIGEVMTRHAPHLRMSERCPADLVLPQP